MMRTLDISRNSLEAIPADLGTNNVDLKRIYLQENKLKELPTHLVYSPNMTVVDLENNSLDKVEDFEKQDKGEMDMIDVSGNDAMGLLNRVKSSSVFLVIC